MTYRPGERDILLLVGLGGYSPLLGLGVEVVTVVNESYLLLRRPIIVYILRVLWIIRLVYILYSSRHRAGVRTSCTRARPSTVGLSKHTTRVWILEP